MSTGVQFSGNEETEASAPAPIEGSLHTYAPRKVAFQFGQKEEGSNAVVFIGGLTDGLLTVPYAIPLSTQIPAGWTLFQIQFSSSYQGWGTGSLDRDVAEINELVRYLREKRGKKKVVLVGHSTGCQDTLHYLLSSEYSDSVDGGVLQAPVSDREAIANGVAPEKLAELNAEAKKVFEESGPDELLSRKFSKVFLGAPLNAYRWLSLAAPGGDDDYFSSDLEDDKLEKTFGQVRKPLLVLVGGDDEFVPPHVDRQKLVDRWRAHVKANKWSPLSRVVAGASHNLSKDEQAQQEAVSLIVQFLQTV